MPIRRKLYAIDALDDEDQISNDSSSTVATKNAWIETMSWRGQSRLRSAQVASSANRAIPLDEIQIDDKLHFIEEPVKIIDREVKRLKQSRIPIVKVRWNSQRGPKFTWEREDQMKKKYPHLFSNSAPVADVTS
ncbi:hypothetical protein Tco_0974387 [Tanacetum coccineum]|uniref:Reverse transcriptase domain-containing protein n=1 Tax=Tanacetum coccineum TaxID=301880 RepID=A0ABQ5EBE8_9ASTR